MKRILWEDLKIVIFDVDGTLYNQGKLRRIILGRLLLFYLPRPWKFKDIVILYWFRKEREARAGFESSNLSVEQYCWCSKKTGYPLAYVKTVVEKWIFKFPNKYLQRCVYPGVKSFIEELKIRGIYTAVYSDYAAMDKLNSMNIEVDFVVSSTDPVVNTLKPGAKGLKLILAHYNIIDSRSTIYIGDRYDLDGKCAENAGVPFLLFQKNDQKFYLKMFNELTPKPTKILTSVDDKAVVTQNL